MAERKNHKKKLAQRKLSIVHAKNSYKKMVQKQITMIQEQIAHNQSTNIDMHVQSDPNIAAPTSFTDG